MEIYNVKNEFIEIYSKCLLIIEKLNEYRFFKDSIRTTLLGIRDISENSITLSLMKEYGYPVQPQIGLMTIPIYAFEPGGIDKLIVNTIEK